MIILLSVIALITYFLAKFYSKVRSLPPGPMPFPMIGNFHQMVIGKLKGYGTIDILRNLHKQYGDIYTLWLGPIATVHICDVQKAQEAMVKKGVHFSNRPTFYLFNVVREGRGVISSNNKHWSEQRRFALFTLRNFGLGRNLMQDRIMLEYEYRFNKLNQEIEKNGGKLTLNPAYIFEVTVGNIINRLLFTERFTEEKEKEFFALKRIIDEITDKMTPFDFMMTKFNTQYFPFKQRLQMIEGTIKAVVKFIQKQIDERKADIKSGRRDLSGGAEDFVDAFLMEMKKDDVPESFNEESLAITLLDLWVAGQETTSSTLYWAFAYLLGHTQVLNKLQEEIDKVTGRSRSLELADKPHTPYLNGVITETLRMSSIVPMNLLRDTDEDTIVGEYVIPKGTAIATELSVIMSDPDYFDEPLKFKPERYLESDLESRVMAFGIGKRSCLGESLARAELYLILGNIVGTYKLSADPKHPSCVEAFNEFGTMRRAKQYQMIIEKRE